jgi:hypothetical protein
MSLKKKIELKSARIDVANNMHQPRLSPAAIHVSDYLEYFHPRGCNSVFWYFGTVTYEHLDQ